MTTENLIEGENINWSFNVQFSDKDDQPVLMGEALHPGNFQGGAIPVTKELIERSLASFNGVDLIAGHPPIMDPSPPDKIWGSVVQVAMNDQGAMVIKGIPDETELGKQQTIGIKKGRLQLSIGAKPIYKNGELWMLKGDHIATVRRGHAEDPDTTINIAMSKIEKELEGINNNSQSFNNDHGQGGLKNMSEGEKENQEFIELKKKIEQQETHIGQLMEKEKERSLNLANEKLAELIVFAEKNGLKDRTKELGELKPGEVQMSELQDLEIAMLKEYASIQAELAKKAQQKQVNLGSQGNGAGVNLTPEQKKAEVAQLARKQMHDILAGNRTITLKKGGE